MLKEETKYQRYEKTKRKKNWFKANFLELYYN